MRVGQLPDLCQYLNVKETFASALKRAAGITARKFDLNLVKRWWQNNPNFKVEDVYQRTPSDGSLFIPLKAQFFEAFRAGTKTEEYRVYGPRWNEKTCAPGRRVTLSMGYGKASRLKGVIEGFEVVTDTSGLPGWKECYGSGDVTAARIKIKLD